jgi:catechol 2,3-dioxygenase-like lactoylglutathione lyase family enzyme
MLRLLLPTLLVLGGSAAAGGRAAAQVAPQATPLRVFLDCQRCDFDHLRREVTFVDYVRQAADAQVHVLVTSQETGGGGQAFTLYFIGQREFASRSDTLLFNMRQDQTEDEERAALTRTFTLGLVPFAARTGIAPGLSIDYDAPEGAAGVPPQRDPWNLWVFRVGVGTELQGESRQSSASFDGSISASRTTEDLKVDFSLRGDYQREEFELDDSTDVVVRRRDYDAEGLTVWSLGRHWSTGVFAAARTSTRQNQDLALEIAPAIEYNYYPYEESTRRQILFTYTVGPVYYDYEEETLFDKFSETLVRQRLEISAGFQQPWGEIDASLEGSNYFHDPELHRIDLFSRLEVRLFRGLSLDVRGNIARIKDQIYISREDLSDEDIFLELRELGTDFEYELEVGFSYSFGSLFNNVVNPRLRLGGNNNNF